MPAHPDTTSGRHDPRLTDVVGERRHLINLAYRLLGSLTEAEDAVQETYARWYRLSPPARLGIESPGAWLTRVASRVCLDMLGSARNRRERYVGEWLPEPLPEPGEWATDPADRITLDESINMAFLVVLESMTPAERVAFVLHDVFRYPFGDVAEITGRTPAACRQLASSARRRIHATRAARAGTPPTGTPAAAVRGFKRAWEAQDIGALIGLLDPDVVAVADGGGRASAAPHPIEGAERVAHHYVDLARAIFDDPTGDLTIVERTVNGTPGLVVRLNRVVTTVLAFHLDGDRIRHIWAVRNPDKLGRWSFDAAPPADPI